MKKFILLSVIAILFASCSTTYVYYDDVYSSRHEPVVYKKVIHKMLK